MDSSSRDRQRGEPGRWPAACLHPKVMEKQRTLHVYICIVREQHYRLHLEALTPELHNSEQHRENAKLHRLE